MSWVDGEWVPPVAPAPIVPAASLEAYVAVVASLVTAEVGAGPARDAATVEQASRVAIDVVGVFLDRDVSYTDVPSVPARVTSACVATAAVELRRPGFAYGLTGYDDTDPAARRAWSAIRADLAPDLKQRWGIG